MCVVLGTALAPLRPSLARSKSRTSGGEGLPLKLHAGKVQAVVTIFSMGSAEFKIQHAKPHGRLPGGSGTQG